MPLGNHRDATTTVLTAPARHSFQNVPPVTARSPISQAHLNSESHRRLASASASTPDGFDGKSFI
jgi:hypothetical protein